MSVSERITTLQTRLTKIQTAINATLDRGVASYSTEIQSLASLGLEELRKMETATLNELASVERVNSGGARFGKIGFARAT